ncbi:MULTISPECIES: glycine cleavage system protein GcvH [Facklamia]|uniref:Glycine cleavage system H protein n=1 Tax=Facklamia hominis TaxID=178214 RepID=A0AAJ1Q540_9LACT|nr:MULTISPECIES: glycine cleavage system protein GcvH [Facklamia]MDK7187853.1 glycine cleavage system protein GcvH [Facklamia hominis]OFL66091.1 glycine cleavage system protein H [Facklamia sp. HMSC062C11]PKY93454.1 glycine cleavage system protein H [Facklamia hominis]
MSEVFFTEEHDFIEVLAANKARVGLTAFAAEQLGDVVHVELPEVDDEFDADEEIATVESVKSVSEVALPFGGKIVAINEELEDAPELVNEDPRGKGWFFEIETSEDIDTSALLAEEPAE